MSYVCNECDNVYDSKRALSIHRSKSHELGYTDEETLRRLYHEEGLSQSEIGDKFGVNSNTIAYQMDKLDIEADMRYYDPHYPPHHHFFKNESVSVGYEYERVSTYVDGSLYTIPIHRLVAVGIGEIEPSEFFDWDIVVHHKSGHGLDNRHCNLERMTRGDHTSHHKPWEGNE